MKTYYRPSTRGELRDKLLEGVECEVAASASEMTVVMLQNWLNFYGFEVADSPNAGWMLYKPSIIGTEPTGQI